MAEEFIKYDKNLCRKETNMTVEELYKVIGGDYEQAKRVLRIDKLIDKHIRRLADNSLFEKLFKVRESLDKTAVFEAGHAIKGVCANLGLVTLSRMASDLTEEFRDGAVRKMSDDEVRAKIDEIEAMYNRTIEGIREYAASQN